MNKATLKIMRRLRIDRDIRGLISKLWDHGYDTTKSCVGHGSEAYVMFFGKGDGWFEEQAESYGLRKVENGDCCVREFLDDVKSGGLNPESFVDKRRSCSCGAGVNGYTVYRGRLKNP